MMIQLLEIPQAEKLSACRYALSLGLNSQQNLLEQFLTYTCQLMQTGKGLLAFHQEPYLWHQCAAQLHAIDILTLKKSLNTLFLNEDMVDESHAQYSTLIDFLAPFKPKNQSAIAIQLRKSDQTSLGYVVLFNAEAQIFTASQKQLLHAYCTSFIQQFEQKIAHDHLKELYDQEVALNFSKTKFFSIISHDLRAPFHGLLGFAEILAKERETLDDASAQNIADYLYDTAQSTYNLLESLLNWSMAEGGRFNAYPIEFKLRQVTSIVTDILRTLAVKKNIQLINDVPEEIRVYADMNMVTSLIQNLVSNALKFTEIDGVGTVTIRAEKQDAYVAIYIQDTGLGMTEEQIQGLFQPRLTVSLKGTAGEKGAGLGLTLCKRFVDLNHGEISVSSKEGEGTTFKVLLPIASEDVALCIQQKNKAKLV